MKSETILLTMSDGKAYTLHRMLPQGEIKAVIVLSHGMAEHSLRYQRFAKALNEANYVLYAGDHRAHGKTAETDENLGYLGDGVTFKRVVEDIHEVVLRAKKENAGKKIFLLGHSFGSFISQSFIEQHGNEIDGCMLSGTAGPRLALVRIARILASLICTFFGSRHKSRFLDSLAFGSYSKTIKNPKTKYDWISRDENEVNLYINDPHSCFLMTASFFRELFGVLSSIHTKKAMASIPRVLPILLFAGDDDPVGSYGQTVKALADEYRKNGIADVTLKLYSGGRHEMLNETNRQEVTEDLLYWLKSRS